MTTPTTSISFYDIMQSKEGKPFTVGEFLQKISDPAPDVAEKIQRIREMVRAGKKKQSKKIKDTLPGVTLSGTFFGNHSKDALEEHSGLVQIDIDGDDLPPDADLSAIRETLEADPHLPCVFLSPSGDGLKAACRVPACDTAEEHEAAWFACERYFKEALGLKIDAATKDVSRICFFSHDPALFINWQAEELDVDAWKPLTTDEKEARRLYDLMEKSHFKGIGTPPPEAAPVLSNDRGDILGEEGNLVCLQGPVKSGKTALLSACVAALVGAPEDADTLSMVAPPHDGAILHFDCEQGERNHYRLMDTIIRKRCRLKTDPPNLHSFNLLDRELADRWPLVEHIAETVTRSSPLRCVFFDGGADFLASLNDEVSAFEMVDRQFKFARKYRCLVVIVLHENPGTENGKTRGHYGSQLHRKCQASLVVEKGTDDISSVYGSPLRDGCWPKSEATHFLYDLDAGMHVECKDPTEERKSRKDAAKDARNTELAERVLGAPMPYQRFLDAVALEKGCSEATARTRYREMKDAKIIVKNTDGNWEINVGGQ